MTPDLIHKLIPLVALGLNLVLLGSVLAADRKSPRNRVFAYLASALGVWNLGVLGLRSTAHASTALAWEQFLHLGVIPIPVLFYHYVLAFLDVPRRRLSLVLGYVLCGIFLAISPSPTFMAGVRETFWGYSPVPGPAYGAFFVYFHVYLVIGLTWLVRAYRSVQSSFRKNRTLLVILGVGVSILGGSVDFIRFIFGWEWLYPIGIPSNAAFALALGVALVRYRLIDLGVLAKRVVLYLLTCISLAPVLIVGLYVLDPLLPDLTPKTHVNEFRDAVVLLLAVMAALPILRKLEEVLERLILHRQHGVRDALVALSKEMVSILDARQLSDTLTTALVARIPVSYASLYVADPSAARFGLASRAIASEDEAERSLLEIDDRLLLWLRFARATLVVEEAAFRAVADVRVQALMRQLEARRVALVLPLFLQGELAAILVVGEKLSAQIFNPNEIELLETLMGHAAIALTNARLYDDLRRQMDELKRTQAQLLQSAKLAAIGEMAAAVAHEISNPLMVILGYTGRLLHELGVEPAARDKLLMIETQAHRAGKIIRNLLGFARRREPTLELLNVHDVVARSIELAAGKLATVPVTIETDFDPRAPAIRGDRDQLMQVFVNLITNAVDAMPEGGRVLVRTEVHGDETGQCLAVGISDSGVGMTEQQQTRIFEPFYTTKPEEHGTGLGLSVSLGIITRHGGTIGVESTPGKGTTITVNLPISPESEASRPGVDREVVASTGPGRPSL